MKVVNKYLCDCSPPMTGPGTTGWETLTETNEKAINVGFRHNKMFEINFLDYKIYKKDDLIGVLWIVNF